MEKSILKQKRKLGFSLGLLLVSSEIVFTVLLLLLNQIGVVTEENSTLITYVVNAFSMYVVSYLLLQLALRKVENAEKRPKVKLGTKKMLWYLFIVLGMGTFCSTFTNEIVTMITNLFNIEIADRVSELMSNSNPIPMVLFVAIIGPIFEELIFRGLLLKKLRVYGDKTAIIYTSIAFGLFHTNVSQILYAGVIGAVLAYVVVKTNNIKYSIIMHIIVNMLSSIATIFTIYGMEVMQIIYAVMLMLLTIVAVIVVPIRGAKNKVDIPNDSKYDKKKLYNNIGYIFSCIIVIIITILGSVA
ncbi:MAG: CPBP family intramembrane metalloprotease [Clostridia bacterium]|nr:CPBP family intramembrane metalloprotease [Clostridia bacterium]